MLQCGTDRALDLVAGTASDAALHELMALASTERRFASLPQAAVTLPLSVESSATCADVQSAASTATTKSEEARATSTTQRRKLNARRSDTEV
ncbi:hypothetical protein PF004_g27936 [Phytophthora fragariae]|uniref:Uncharacterized protein n=1 Tax=Phytophthora fragariae TaxID=53985 RepID=A0A6G0MJ49_9STRA|nr:hypothetical protein PF004_g27936 [Phytophthora fragariae]